MKLPARQCGTLLWILVFQFVCVPADAALVLDEPKAVKQSTEYQYPLKVLEDGFARLHLKWSEPSDKGTVDLSLSTFKAKGQPEAIVGFVGGKQGTGSLLPYLQNVPVLPDGTEILLAGTGLTYDVNYVGELSVTVGKRQMLVWEITLIRPSAVALFRCPSGTQTVDPDGSTAIDFQRMGPLNEKAIGLRLSAFTSNDKELGQVGFITQTSIRELQRELPSYPLEGQHFIPPIRAVGLTEGATYSGRVWFVVGARDVMECSLDLLMPKLPRGELVSDSQSLTRTVTLPIIRLSNGHDPSLSVRLFEKTRTRRIDGITALLDGGTESPEGAFDLKQHVSFSLNGTEVPDFTQLQSSMADEKSRPVRTLQPGEQLNLDMRLHDLDAGKYAFALRFTGVNVSNSTKLDVAINVRHHWLWAVVAVIIALALSFVISKGIVSWRERIRVGRRVQQLKQERFEEHIDVPSVSFLHVVLAQTEKLIQSTWLLPPPPSVYDFLARAERVATILRRYSSLQEALDDAPCTDSVKDHYREAIAEVMHRIGAQPLDQKTTDTVVEELGKIAMRLDDPSVWYQSHLTNEGKTLAKQARAVKDKLGEPAVVDALLNTLDVPPKDWTVDGQKFDDAYWMVKLLYSRRTIPNANTDLTAEYKKAGNLAQTFEVADQQAWNRLKAAVKDKRVTIEPLPTAETLESLSPIKFGMKFEDRALEESYLVRNVLKYKWNFHLIEVTPAQRSLFWRLRRRLQQRLLQLFGSRAKQPPQPFDKSVILNGPRVTQDVPRAGQLEVSATILWPSAAGGTVQELDPKNNAITIHIDENTELSFVKSLNGSEILLLVIVAIVTLATSLPALYFAKATFGSIGDYVAILAWAIGIDQGKNLIQLLKAYPADVTPTGPSP